MENNFLCRKEVKMAYKVGKNVTIKDNVVIGDNVVIEDDVYIDYGVIIRDNVHIKKGTFIGARCILGEYLMDFVRDRVKTAHPLVIGENSILRSETIIYGDTEIGASFQTGHRVTIREKSKIGNHVNIGTLSDIQGDCEIGNYVHMHSNVHIGQKSVIKNYVWIFPYVVLTNDPTPPSETLKGVYVDEYAVIATGTVVLPGIRIGADSLVGAGSTVTKDVNAERVVVGNPARELGMTSIVKDKNTGECPYPWRYSFDRGMPWEGIGYDMWLKNNK